MLQPPPNCGEDGEGAGRAEAAAAIKSPSPPQGEDGSKRVLGDCWDVSGNPVFSRFEDNLIGECLRSLVLMPRPRFPEELVRIGDIDTDDCLRKALGVPLEENNKRTERLCTCPLPHAASKIAIDDPLGKAFGIEVEEKNSTRTLPPSATKTPSSSKIISSVASKHSFTGPDGITRTKYVFKKRFADCSEESVEEERTEFPRS
jgi:hypothetical protein